MLLLTYRNFLHSNFKRLKKNIFLRLFENLMIIIKISKYEKKNFVPFQKSLNTNRLGITIVFQKCIPFAFSF